MRLLDAFIGVMVMFRFASGRLLKSQRKIQDAPQPPADPCYGLASWYPPGETHVQRMCNDNFPRNANAGTFFVEFYTPWCPQCQRFKEYWEYFAAYGNAPGTVSAVDCEKNKGVCNELSVNAYPTVKAFHNGQWSEGPFVFDVDALKKWADDVVGGGAPIVNMVLQNRTATARKPLSESGHPEPCLAK
mmetsp:Transcript_74214/g.117469  ORF Transcript_74214/g.117469 Transcript_74214/m.117469 type:complete len:188 (+) Transcript_74214:81-644(+)